MRTFLRLLAVAGLLLLALMILLAIIYRDRRPRIYFAAEEGNTNAIAQYLASGSNVNDGIICYPFGYRRAPLLHIAAENGQTNAVAFLLDHGANPNQRDNFGRTCLDHVIGMGGSAQLHVLEMLLQAGADPNLRSSNSGWTPLIHAVVLNSTNMMQAMIAAGANVNYPSAGGETPLHHAETVEAAKLLLLAGADPNTPFTYVMPVDQSHPSPVTNTVTPIDIARREHRADVLTLLTNWTKRTND